MAAHFSILAWRIPSTEEPGRLHRVTKSWTQLSNFHFRLLRSTHKHMICKNVVYSCFPTFQKLLKKILLYSICLFLNLKTICMYLFVFLKLYFSFNWKIISLQYYDGFYCTSTQISQRYTYVSSLLNLSPIFLRIPPSRLLQSMGLGSLCHRANSHWLSA